jgi:hypothetical protein
MKRTAIDYYGRGAGNFGLECWPEQAGEFEYDAGTSSGWAGGAPQGKRRPQAKTQPEFDAYNAAAALTDPAAQEKAADDFATSFRTASCAAALQAAMHGYQQANNADKMLEMARKVLTFDPDDPEALLGVAQVLAERTRDTDLDKDQRIAEARKDAQRALVTVDTDIPTRRPYAPEKLERTRALFVRRLRDSGNDRLQRQGMGRCGRQI